MPSMTLSIPEDFKKKMEKFNWLNWSSIAREAFAKRIAQLEALEKFKEGLENSELSEKDCIELGKKIKESMAEYSDKK